MSRTAKAAFALLLVTFLSKGLGFVRDILIASQYGASSLNDIFIVAQDVPVLLFSVVTAAIATGYVPLFMQARNESEARANKLTSQLVILVTGLSILICMASWLLMPVIVKIVAIGFEGEKYELAVRYTRILMLNIIFVGAASVLRAYHQAKERYVLSALNAFLANVVVIGVFFFSSPDSIELLVFGALAGLSLDFFVQWVFAKRGGFKLEKGIDWLDPYLQRFFSVMTPVIIGTMIGQISVMIDKTMASTLPDGSITYINTAFKLMTFVNGIFAVSLGTVIYPMLSKFSADDNMQAYKWSLMKSVNMILLMITPITVITMVLSVPVVQLLFERGKFTHADTRATAAALVCFALGMVGLGLREVLSKAFYSLNDTKTPMVNGAIAVLFNIVLNLVLIGPMKHAGLALSSSLAVILTSLMLLGSLRRKIGRINGRRMLMAAAKNLTAGILMALAVWGFDYGLVAILSRFAEAGSVDHSGLLVELTLDTIIGLLVYGGVVWILRVEEVRELADKIRRRIVSH